MRFLPEDCSRAYTIFTGNTLDVYTSKYDDISASSFVADGLRPLAVGFFIDALFGAAILGEAMLGRVTFAEQVGIAGRNIRCADHAGHGRAALRTPRQRCVGEFLQHVEMRLTMGAPARHGSVFINGHAGMVEPPRADFKHISSAGRRFAHALPAVDDVAEQQRRAFGVVDGRVRLAGVPVETGCLHRAAEHGLAVGEAAEGGGIDNSPRKMYS